MTAELWTGGEIRGELFTECKAMQLDVEKVYAASNSGSLGTTELSSTLMGLVANLCEFPEFNKSIAASVIDELSVSLTTEDFNDVINQYADDFQLTT